VANGSAKLGFYTTSAHTAAKVVLKAGQKILLQETIAINPGKPYQKQLALPAGLDEHDLVASISDGGRELVSYSPVRLQPQPPPRPVTTPPAPVDVKSNEELYLIGLRAEQFHDPNLDPAPYWQEALRRDPGDVRVNTVLGIGSYRKARYQEAERYLRTALDRATERYTAPKDGEAFYYLGAVLKAEGRNDEAFTQFYKATWSQGWKAAGYYSLTEIAAARGDMAAALDFVNRSIDSNALNVRAQNLKASILRHVDRVPEALLALAAAHRTDPLDVRSMAERWLASRTPADAKVLGSTMNLHPATAQETAAEYLNAGLWQDGTDALLQMTAAAPDKSKIHPMAYYYLGYFAGKLGQAQKASEYYKLASAAPPDYVFPFQNEAVDVLRAAIGANAHDARAPYYLGNLLYDWEPVEATKWWEASAAIDPSFAITHRNLAVAYIHLKPEGDPNRAIAELEKAVALDRKFALHFTELDELYEQAGTPIEKRVPLFERNRDVVAQRDDAQNRAIGLEIAAGKYDDAIRMMTGRAFAAVEGANLNVAEHWTDAHLMRGRAKLTAQQYREALSDFETAITLPSNLPAGLGFSEGAAGGMRAPEFAYWTGMTYEAMGDRAKATEVWNRGAAALQGGSGRRGGGAGGAGAQSYYQALCLQKSGQSEKATALFQSLVDSGQAMVRAQPSNTGGGRGGFGRPQPTRIRQANGHYLAGLGYLGLNDARKAKAELTEAVQTSPDLLGARTTLATLN
jgi:tetratricopeptide (TPR) repeat protein